MSDNHIYVRIPEPLEVKKSLLEAKKTIYLQLHSNIEFSRRREEKIRLIEKVQERIGEIKQIIDKLERTLPETEEFKRTISHKDETGEKVSKTPVIEEIKEIKEETKTDLDELRKIEEELLNIEKELKKLL